MRQLFVEKSLALKRYKKSLEENSVNLISYSEFIKDRNKLINITSENIFIDTEPNFRIGTLIGIILQPDFISSNYLSKLDNIYSSLFKNINFSNLNENTLKATIF